MERGERKGLAGSGVLLCGRKPNRRDDNAFSNRKRMRAISMRSITLLKQEVEDTGRHISIPGLGMGIMVLQISLAIAEVI